MSTFLLALGGCQEESVYGRDHGTSSAFLAPEDRAEGLDHLREFER